MFRDPLDRTRVAEIMTALQGELCPGNRTIAYRAIQNSCKKKKIGHM